MEGIGLRTKRGYNRDVQKDRLRDYRLFAIGCEGGKREPQYFEVFEHLSRRIKVDIIDKNEEDYETKSSPSWVLERVSDYIKTHDLLEEDEVWFVVDIDQWTQNDLKKIEELCRKKANLNVVFSNPCFEVWLYLHKKENFDALKQEPITCKRLKKEVGDLFKGGYCPLIFVQNVETAYQNAKKIDLSKGTRPNSHQTKVYQLIEALLNFAPQKDKEYFFKKKIPNLLEEKYKKK